MPSQQDEWMHVSVGGRLWHGAAYALWETKKCRQSLACRSTAVHPATTGRIHRVAAAVAWHGSTDASAHVIFHERCRGQHKYTTPAENSSIPMPVWGRIKLPPYPRGRRSAPSWREATWTAFRPRSTLFRETTTLRGYSSTIGDFATGREITAVNQM